MKKFHIKIILIFLIGLINSNILYAISHSGKKILYLGDAASSQGRGGTGVSQGTIDLFYLNPAAIASVERTGFGLQYGTLDNKFSNPNITLAFPTSYGVFGSCIRYIKTSDYIDDLKEAYYLSLGGAKYFTEQLMIGAALNIISGSTESNNIYYTGLTLGSIYNININKDLAKGLGFYKPSIGISINTGKAIGEKNKEYIDMNQLCLGYNFMFYRTGFINFTLFNDISIIKEYDEYPVKIGIETEISRSYIFRAGIITPDAYDYGDYTIGLGYNFKTSALYGTINYSLVHYREKKFVHYLGFNAFYGEPDITPPATSIEISEKYISPNYDGNHDYVLFKTDVADESRIKGWKLQITDSEKIIREFSISERDIDRDLTVPEFIAKIWQKKESMTVPEKILWDGTGSNGGIVKDGKYNYSFIAWDERDNISSAKQGIIIVDNTPPDVELIIDDRLFSPNGDGNKETLRIDLKLSIDEQDSCKAGFTDKEGNILKSYEWIGKGISSISWDGKDGSGVDAPEGLYNFYIETWDNAGNKTRRTLKDLSLTRNYETADITASKEYFSFKRDSEINLFPNLSQKNGLESWEIIVEDDDEDPVKIISGETELPKLIKWDLKDKNEKQLDDGKYYIKLKTKFASGNTPTSFKKELIIDSTLPGLAIKFFPEIFSPDGDGENDLLTISPVVRDDYGIKEWYILIYSPSGSVFKSFNGKGIPGPMIIWDGRGNDNTIVESAADYYIELIATDLAGNSSRLEKIKLPIDILVLVTERGLKIRISNIEFDYNSSDIKNQAIPVLDRVASILKKYSRYNVLIEGHTDDIGDEEKNLKLSEARAKAVQDYLIGEGLEPERLSFRGMGETSPFVPNKDIESRRRNRRVEFILIKKDM